MKTTGCPLEELLHEAAELMFTGRYEEAIAQYNCADTSRANTCCQAVICNNKGFCYKNVDQYDCAMDNLFAAIRIVPDFSNPHAILGDMYQEIGEDDNAQRFYLKTLEIISLVRPEQLNKNDYRAYIRAEAGLELMGFELPQQYRTLGKILETFKK